jgi:hypothetical protein
LYSNNFWILRAIHDLLTIAYLLTGAPAVTTTNVSDSTPAEDTPCTALIIPFPVRPKPASPDPNVRLAVALASLNAALAEQRVAVAAWRQALGELKTTTAGLHEGLQRYKGNLQALGNSVSALAAKARSLEEWADGVVAVAD